MIKLLAILCAFLLLSACSSPAPTDPIENSETPAQTEQEISETTEQAADVSTGAEEESHATIIMEKKIEFQQDNYMRITLFQEENGAQHALAMCHFDGTNPETEYRWIISLFIYFQEQNMTDYVIAVKAGEQTGIMKCVEGTVKNMLPEPYKSAVEAGDKEAVLYEYDLITGELSEMTALITVGTMEESGEQR